MLAQYPEVHLTGIDQDTNALARAAERLEPYQDRVTLRLGNFRDILETLPNPADFILMDIGVSSMQLDDPERGFSFLREGPLDMRMDERNSVSAFTIVNTWREPDLARLIWQYGEERASRAIAAAIARQRKKGQITTTTELATLIAGVVRGSGHIHPATRTFQALRIEVNRELESLEHGMLAARAALAPGGILTVLSFHSLEDRIVKHMMRSFAAAGLGEVLTKKPILPTAGEIRENPRARSVKLRAFRAKHLL
jgi:16S rRNA (cytosine1402-N4)-methyltransferase